MSNTLDSLDRLSVDWSDFNSAGRTTRALAKQLAGDKKTLGWLVHAIEDSAALREKCEHHQLLDYLILYDALERGFRIRLHLATEDHRDRPHDHRFSFSSLILRGEYSHTLYRVPETFHENPDEECGRQWIDQHHTDPTGGLHGRELEILLNRVETAGASYTLHHSALHTTYTTPGTVSLFIRGPAEKRRSVIMDKASDTVWWRYGAPEETETRREKKIMSDDLYRDCRNRLYASGVI